MLNLLFCYDFSISANWISNMDALFIESLMILEVMMS